MTTETAALRRTSTWSAATAASRWSSWPPRSSWPSWSSGRSWILLSTDCALTGGSVRRRTSSWAGSLLSLQRGDDTVEVIGLDQDVACLRPLAGADDAAALEDVHEPPGLGEPHPQLALEHRGGPELGGDDELDRLDHQVEVVADVVVELALGGRRSGDVLAVAGLQLLLAVLDDHVDLGLGDPGTLHPDRLRGTHRQEEAVALPDQLLRTGLVEDHPAVGEARGRERQPRR